MHKHAVHRAEKARVQQAQGWAACGILSARAYLKTDFTQL